VARAVIWEEQPEDHTVRPAWLAPTLESCEHLSARLQACDRSEARDLLSAFTRGVQPPAGHAEWLILRGLLLDVAVRTTAAQHGRLHLNPSKACGLKMERLLDDLTSSPVETTLSHFESWHRRFFEALDRAHPPSLGSSIGFLVRRDFRSRWNLSRLSRRFKASPSTIRKSFRKKFGRSVHEYQQLARIVASLDEVRSTKVEAIARGVGFRSTKNFYNAFRRLLGRTPREYRLLPDEEASRLKTVVHQQLTHQTDDNREHSGR
jgi:AraC-like DNA-binding protein